ncbi:NADH:flavin oxidoreductase/NADH oxidase family protein [Shewanella intestini]|uniref:NADH:flavin oxidoreductase/NADH oxidase family protein n=1 Tax=Shewanella intestini TaxID=2017544 RepID=A0ABS5I1Z6_9GAMM|nr:MULTISPECIES: NADH:flavin oxidoreductase/NADH oxidase family protein [Shewanella]MBR9728051.1 NADH:flavin oxidoreductase/NADH oxidase family protein [Shewanella intestini]MRG36397.1 NADH oxidase [Shewanella sp. XMDDZSB0408]
MSQPQHLSSPLKITAQATTKNRLFKSAMSEQLGDKTFAPSAQLVNLYKVWANGGTGILITGNVMVDRTALGEPKNVVLDSASDVAPFKKWAQAGTQNNTQLWMQLNHPGKQTPKFLSPVPVAPSAVPLSKALQSGFNTPRALEENEILAIVECFAVAAEKAQQAGFTGVQIHGAHGYLVSQFLSPHHNRRDDKWGGSLENRMRFVREIYRAIRTRVGNEFPIGIKLNSADFQKGGFSEDDSIEVMKTLEQDGINLLEISGGNYENPSMMGAKVKKSTVAREAYFLDYAEKAKQVLSIPLVVTGGFRSSHAMESALTSQATDMIGVARPLAVVPDLANKLLADSSYTIALKPLTTGVKSLDFMAMLNITWYEQQLKLIGQGKSPKPNMSAWTSVLRTFAGMGRAAFKKRRA